MKNLIALALAAASVYAWDEVTYGRRTNYTNRGHTGPKGRTSKYDEGYNASSGNFEWGSR